MPNIYDILKNRTTITYGAGEEEEEVNEGSVTSRYTNALQQFNKNNQSDDQGQVNGAGIVLGATSNNRRGTNIGNGNQDDQGSQTPTSRSGLSAVMRGSSSGREFETSLIEEHANNLQGKVQIFIDDGDVNRSWYTPGSSGEPRTGTIVLDDSRVRAERDATGNLFASIPNDEEQQDSGGATPGKKPLGSVELNSGLAAFAGGNDAIPDSDDYEDPRTGLMYGDNFSNFSSPGSVPISGFSDSGMDSSGGIFDSGSIIGIIDAKAAAIRDSSTDSLFTDFDSISFGGQGEINRSGDASSIKCDELLFPEQGTFYGEGAPPSLLEEVTMLPEDFIFDQRGASEIVDREGEMLFFDPFDNRRNPWWAPWTYNKNIIIPQQFYYNDYLSDSMFFRDPSEQEDPRYNFGSRATVLNDDFRYCCGGTWDHTSVDFGQPTTVYDSAFTLDFQKQRVPNLPSPEQARQNRGILFFNIEPVNWMEGNPDEDDEGYYMSGLELYASSGYLNRVLSNREGRQISGGEVAPLLYNFIFEATGQTLDDPRDNWRFDPLGIPGAGDILEDEASPLTTTTTYYSKNFFDHTFQAPVGYSRSYVDFYPSRAETNNLVEIKSHFATGDLQIQDPTDPNSAHEFVRPSFYRALESFMESGTSQPSIPCVSDKVQKFPHEQVRRAKFLGKYLHSGGSIFDEPDQETSTFVREFYELFDSYNSITFNMSSSSQISEWFEQTHLMTIFFEMLDQTYPINSTFYTQVLDAWLNTSLPYVERREEDNRFKINSDLAAVNLRPNEIPYPFEQMKKMLSQQAFLNRPEYEGEIEIFTYPLGFPMQEDFGLGRREDELPPIIRDLNEEGFLDFLNTKFLDTPKDFWENGEDLTFYDAIAEYKKYNSSLHRSAYEMFHGATSYSEVLAYRIEKIDTSTGTVIQNFFLANTHDAGEFTFLDTQVVPGKRYTYRIFTINFVVGSKYNYETNNMAYEKINLIDSSNNTTKRFSPETTSGDLFGTSKYAKIRMPISISPDIRLIEAPYYEQQITTVSSDLPPLFPDVSAVESHRTTQNYLEPTMFMLTPQFGSLTEDPVPMMPEDQLVIQRMKENQEFSRQLLPDNQMNTSPDRIVFRSDTLPTQYEMFFSFRRPRGYVDLYGSQMLTTPANQPFFDVDIPLNKEFFVTFRARDAGGISNPGPIYEFIKHNYGDGTYFSFEILEIHPPESNLTFESLLSIEPSIYQRSIDFNPDHTTLIYGHEYRRSQGFEGWGIVPINNPGFNNVQSAVMRLDSNNLIPYSTVPPSIDLISLGNSSALGSDLIWNRKFKFRITSTTSGNSFDLNTSFKYSKILLKSEDSMTRSRTERCYNLDSAELDRRRRVNSRNSDANLNRVGGTSYNETTVVEFSSLIPSLTRPPGVSDADDVAAAAEEIYGMAGGDGRGRDNERNQERAREAIAENQASGDAAGIGFADRAAGRAALTGEIVVGTGGRLGSGIPGVGNRTLSRLMLPGGRGSSY